VIVVVATTAVGLPGVRARLSGLGVAASDVVAPSDVRRLVLAAVDDEVQAQRLVTRLRAAGELAVMRPSGGARVEAWRRHTQPVTIAGRVSVCFAWSEHDRRDLPDVVELDPEGGFGTGEHPATRLLLEELALRIRGGERVLDVGCGSGVLGLCALRLGAANLLGVDIDADAIAATRRNAALNGVARRSEATCAPLGDVGGVFDVVLANIGRAGLVALAPELVGRVAPGGWLAVSGFSPPQCELVAAFLSPMAVVERRLCGEWAALVLADHRVHA
jgi:ribosomal protein L11 methyltransferase